MRNIGHKCGNHRTEIIEGKKRTMCLGLPAMPRAYLLIHTSTLDISLAPQRHVIWNSSACIPPLPEAIYLFIKLFTFNNFN